MATRPPTTPQVSAVVLAAGGGTRFDGDGHKLLADLGGRPVYRRALDNVLESGVRPIWVVTGAVSLELPDDVTELAHPGWAAGQASSLWRALDALSPTAAQFVVVGLADQPSIPPSAWRQVSAADPVHRIVVASYGGVRGPNPVRLHRSVWPLIDRQGDRGARRVIEMYPDWVHDVACAGSPHDIDTSEDLRSWKSC